LTLALVVQNLKRDLPTSKRRRRGSHRVSPWREEDADEDEWRSLERSPEIRKIAGDEGG
jgi:hypothetical protein